LNWTEFVIATVAVYGAIIATYNFVIYRRISSRGIKVTLEYASAYSPFGFITSKTYDEQKPNLSVTVANSGTRPVTVKNPFFMYMYPNKKGKLQSFNPISSQSFPAELTEGKFVLTWCEGNEIARVLTEAGFSGVCNLVACCSDSVDITYRSKPLRFNVDGYSMAPLSISDIRKEQI